MDNIKEISIDMIDDPVVAMRSDVYDEDIVDLANSIKEHGLLEPLVVRPVGTRYELIAGHRRLTACKRIAKILVPCTIRDVSEDEALVLRMQENTHRLDVDPADDALYFQKLIDKLKLTPEELAVKLGRRVSYVLDRLSILDMPDNLIAAVVQKQVGIRAAQSLMAITDEPYRDSLINIAVDGGITADKADNWFRMWKLNNLPALPTKENMEAVTSEIAPPETAIQCSKCMQAGLVKNMMTVWIHRECPPEPVS